MIILDKFNFDEVDNELPNICEPFEWDWRLTKEEKESKLYKKSKLYGWRKNNPDGYIEDGFKWDDES